MKKLYRFYCSDCDHAWHELLEDNNEETHTDLCDYCRRPQKPEDMKHDTNN
jgi:hypothetical protein